MKYFLIEGTVTNPEKMTETLMAEHQAHTGRLMKEGSVLFSSLKSDMSASVTVVKAEEERKVREFYNQDPFLKNGVLIYHITELQIHFHVQDAGAWF